MTKIDICALCKKESELQNSHAIGNTVFRKILRASKGNAILFSTSNDLINYSNDSWATDQLCKSCESLLNSSYENYAINKIRDASTIGKQNIEKQNFKIKNINHDKIISYFLSILWRISESKHNTFKSIKLSKIDSVYIASKIISKSSISENKFSVKISKLIDRTENGFTIDNLDQLIVAPYTRTASNNTKIYCTVFEGFFIEIHEKPSNNIRTKIGMLNRRKQSLTIPYVNIFDINELNIALMDAYKKHKEGKSTITS